MKFSERAGYTQVNTEIKINEISDVLRNRLWNIMHRTLGSLNLEDLTILAKDMWDQYYKIPETQLQLDVFGSLDTNRFFKVIYDKSFAGQWYQTLDLIEYLTQKKFIDKQKLNQLLENEFSGYRFIEGQLVPLTSQGEVNEVQSALNISDKYAPAREHLRKALGMFSVKEKPDCENIVKESILAVESMAKIVLEKNTGKDTLGQLVKQLKLPPTIQNGFSALYGYSSAGGGIRHGRTDANDTVTIDEARFFLITCSAFINYIIAKQP